MILPAGWVATHPSISRVLRLCLLAITWWSVGYCAVTWIGGGRRGIMRGVRFSALSDHQRLHDCSHPDLILNGTGSCSCIRTPGRLVANGSLCDDRAFHSFIIIRARVKLFMPVLNCCALWLGGRLVWLLLAHYSVLPTERKRAQCLKQRLIIIHVPQDYRHKNISNYLPQKV
jgi:hypothetical protein